MDENHLDALARRVQAGDRNAFAEIYGATHRELRIFLSAHASSPDMVDEVLQASYVACWQSIRKYEPRGLFLAWLKSVARNHLLKALHEQQKAVRGDVLQRAVVDASLEGVDDGEDRLQDCVDRLSPHARDLLRRRYTDRTPVSVIARALGKTASGVAVTLFRIRETLRHCLAGQEGA